MQYFKTIFLDEVEDFLDSLDFKSQKKVVYNVRMAEQTNDPELFKKLNNDIWEFRTKYLGKQIRLLAFWDKTNDTETLVLATSGFIKKTQKTPKNEIDRAERIRKQYFEEKEQEQINQGLSTAEISDKEAAKKLLDLVPLEWIKRIPFFVRGHATTKTVERVAKQYPELYAVAKRQGDLPEKEREELRKIMTAIFEEKMNKHKIK